MVLFSPLLLWYYRCYVHTFALRATVYVHRASVDIVKDCFCFNSVYKTTSRQEILWSTSDMSGEVKRTNERGHGNRGTQRRRSPRRKEQIDVDENLPIVQMFRKFQLELDDKYDRYERLVKLSRDLTVESKRIIFLLHRIMGESQKEKTLHDALKKLKDLQMYHMREMAMELRNHCFYAYLRAYSPGIQEYVEAISFFYYIKDGRLVGLEEIQQDLVYEEQPEEAESDMAAIEPNANEPPERFVLPVTPLDYMLGIADLTGELMRKCINAVGEGNLEEPFVLCRFLRDVYTAFLGFGNGAGREMTRKIWTLFQSVRKVENACYTITVRGSEMPSEMLAQAFSASLNDVGLVTDGD
ncbi:translin-associated protein X-like [Ornithodoros turicata]|uniref:translin-associated protein X-like n=1 Tax=Ornithodoros turicata TaxID=34597 RepID=UPI003139CF92